MTRSDSALPALPARSRAEVARPISYAYLFHLSDDVGLFEHAELTRPRKEHGYCVDDAARGLVVVAREPNPPQQLQRLAERYLSFVIDAVTPSGGVHNRRVFGGGWTDEPSFDDCWGRAVWGLGTAVARLPQLADRAAPALEVTLRGRSRSPRALAFAGMGAVELLSINPGHANARALLSEAVYQLDTATMSNSLKSAGRWPWPEDRLAYANAVLPETMIAAGALLPDDGLLTRGLAQLEWLVTREVVADGHLSVVPASGWAEGEPRPGFDQQPLELAALADAGARAGDITGDPRWDDLVLACAAWFHGANDCATVMVDEETGGGYDGLTHTGRNENRGAESTLAMLSTLQQAQRVGGRR